MAKQSTSTTIALIDQLTLLEEEANRFANRCKKAKEQLVRQLGKPASLPERGDLLSIDINHLKIKRRQTITKRKPLAGNKRFT